MNTVLYDLQAAEARWHDLQVEAEHERLVNAALKLRREHPERSLLSRYLSALRRRNLDGTASDPSKN